MANELATPAAAPTAIAPIGVTDPQAGVIATRPATTPDAAPNDVGLPCRTRSTTSHATIATAPEPSVLAAISAAEPFAASVDPALKPNQPNQSSPAPSITNGRLCGRIGSRGQPTRRPSSSAITKAEAPELISTAVPPAKSMACSLETIQPPCAAPVSPGAAKTQCATGM